MNGSHLIDHSLVANKPADVAATIDDGARELGLKPVRAWVPDSQGKHRSSAAKRTQRHRERKEQDGLKQISLTLPTALHPALREFAKRTRDGESAHLVLRDVFSATPVTASAPPTGPEVSSFDAQLEKLLGSLPTWRQWLLRRLLRPVVSV